MGQVHDINCHVHLPVTVRIQLDGPAEIKGEGAHGAGSAVKRLIDSVDAHVPVVVGQVQPPLSVSALKLK
jgi:hypothetical protein